jgi:hypothetical protein
VAQSADDGDPVGRPHAVLQDGREHRRPGAHQRAGVLGGDLVRQRKGELPVVDAHMGGEPALVASDDRQPNVRTEVLEPALTPLARHA